MHRLTSIVARGEKGAIGAGNRLPWRVRADMRFFRATTLTNVVIMGKRTFASLNGCLPDRHNVIVTHGFQLFDATPSCEPAGSIEEALFLASEAAGGSREAFVIGGATMYAQFAGLVDRYLLTEVDVSVPDADTFFDSALLGDVDRWKRRVLLSGSADHEGNEADFEIVELVAKDSEEVVARRQRLIAEWRKRAPVRKRHARRTSRASEMMPLPL